MVRWRVMNDWTRPVYGTATSTLRRRAADSVSGRNAGSWHPLLTASSPIRTEPKTPVAGAPGIRFYADRPLAAPNGAAISTLCVIDTQPRSLEPDELALLGDLADMTEREIAALHFATTDALTQLTNRRGFEVLARQVLNLCDRLGHHAVLQFFDLNDFKAINDRFGDAEGDRALETFADTLAGTLRDSDVLARLGGDKFVVLPSATDPADVAKPVERVTQALALRNSADARACAIRFSVGRVACDPARHHAVTNPLASADHRMYEDKQRGKTVGT